MTHTHCRTTLADTTFGAIAEAVASDAPIPGGGAAAGLAAALAAGLAAMAARYATATAGLDPEAAATRADELRLTAQRLADDDARAYQSYLDAAKLPKSPDPGSRSKAVRAALDAAADVPLSLAEVAAEVAEMGELLATAGNPRLRSDAVTAACLSGAVASSAAALVGENLHSRPGDPRAERAAGLAAAAQGAAARVAGLPETTAPIGDVHP